jgi:hypothetical protein
MLPLRRSLRLLRLDRPKTRKLLLGMTMSCWMRSRMKPISPTCSAIMSRIQRSASSGVRWARIYISRCGTTSDWALTGAKDDPHRSWPSRSSRSGLQATDVGHRGLTTPSRARPVYPETSAFSRRAVRACEAEQFLSQKRHGTSRFDAVAARKTVTADLLSGKVAHVRQSAPDATAHRSRQIAIGPGPFTACCVRGCDSGLETSRSDRGSQPLFGSRCLPHARVATRQGQ